MKSTKIVTPVLLFLMVILLVIAVYINFVFNPLKVKIEQISFENELMKNQRMEVELAMLEGDAIRKDIREAEALLSEHAELVLIDGYLLADDIYSKAGAFGIKLERINISAPDFADPAESGETVLLYATADLGFRAAYDSAVGFIESMEESRTGAYEVQKLAVLRDMDSGLSWTAEVRLYYYGSRSQVPPAPVESQEKKGAGLLPGLPGGVL